VVVIVPHSHRCQEKAACRGVWFGNATVPHRVCPLTFRTSSCSPSSTAVNLLMAGQGVELVDLGRVRVAGKQDQFVAAGLREGVHGGGQVAGCGERLSDGLVGPRTEEPVIVAQISVNVGVGGRAERETGAGEQPGS
jgi:hypothetical protein